MPDIAKIKIKNSTGEKIVEGEYLGLDKSDERLRRLAVKYNNQIIYFDMKTKNFCGLNDFISNSMQILGVEFNYEK
jgi:hypothetical protein